MSIQQLGLLELHDGEGRPVLVKAANISTVVHRSVNTSDGPALVCLDNGQKEAVRETVDEVKRLLAEFAIIVALVPERQGNYHIHSPGVALLSKTGPVA